MPPEESIQAAPCGPYCPVQGVKEGMAKLELSLAGLHEKQDKLLEISANMKYLEKQMIKIEEKDVRDTTDIYKRLGGLEKTAITKGEVGILSTIAATIVAALSFFIQLIWRK